MVAGQWSMTDLVRHSQLEQERQNRLLTNRAVVVGATLVILEIDQ